MELSFFYHMWGAGMGSLEVFLIESDTATGDTTEFFTLSGDQGNLWQLAVFDLDSLGVNGDFYLQFHGYRGTSYQSDIAIDNITVYKLLPQSGFLSLLLSALLFFLDHQLHYQAQHYHQQWLHLQRQLLHQQ